MHHRRTRRIQSQVEFLIFGLLTAATAAGCGFLDEDLHKSEEAFAASFALEGSGTGGGGFSTGNFRCGTDILPGSTVVQADGAIPPFVLRDPGGLGAWYRNHCRGDGSTICRLVRRQLRARVASSVAVAAAAQNEDDEDDDDADDSRDDDPESSDRNERE